MFEIRHFRLIDALHRTGTVSAAARELGYSQPAISQQIKQLEKEAATPLVLREGRRTRLTQAGEVFLHYGAQAIEAANRAKTEIDLIAGLRGGALTLAAFPSAAATIVPLALASFKARHPGVDVRLVEADAATAVADLRAGRIDVAVIAQFYSPGSPPRPAEEDWMWRTILEEDVYVALPEHHPAASSRVVALHDLADAPWIAGCEECRANLFEAASAAEFVPNIALETDDYVALQRLAALELGVALIPQLMVAAARVDPTLRFKAISPARLRRVSAVSTSTTLRIPGVAELLEALRDACATIEDGTASIYSPSL